MRWFGYSADVLKFDFRWADFGFAGSFDGVPRVTGDPKLGSVDRATIAAVGPLLGGGSLDRPLGGGRYEMCRHVVMDGWPLEAWRMRATDRAHDLARHEPFRRMWRPCVLALRDLGERYVELHEVDRFLADQPSAG